jgi:hypothetical protein
MPRCKQTIAVDDYVLDVLMRDLVGHDRQPAAYLVYLWLYGQAARSFVVSASCRLSRSYRLEADATSTGDGVPPAHTREQVPAPARGRWKPVPASLRTIAEATGLSKSAVQTALECLRRRELIATTSNHATATPVHFVRRHWR